MTEKVKQKKIKPLTIFKELNSLLLFLSLKEEYMTSSVILKDNPRISRDLMYQKMNSYIEQGLVKKRNRKKVGFELKAGEDKVDYKLITNGKTIKKMVLMNMKGFLSHLSRRGDAEVKDLLKPDLSPQDYVDLQERIKKFVEGVSEKIENMLWKVVSSDSKEGVHPLVEGALQEIKEHLRKELFDYKDFFVKFS